MLNINFTCFNTRLPKLDYEKILKNLSQTAGKHYKISCTAFERYLKNAEFYGFEYKVALEIKNHKIIKVDIINNQDNNYAHYAEGVKYKIKKAGNINKDGITGATTISKCLLKAAENAF